MKILLYQKRQKLFDKSGVGRAMRHQIKALDAAGVPYTLNPKENYDIVHLNTLDPASKAMAKKAHKKGKKVVFHSHTTLEDWKKSFILSDFLVKPFKKYLLSMYKQGDCLVTPTPYSKSVLDTYNLNKNIIPISNGIDLSRYAYDEEKIKKYKEFFKIQPGQKVIMSVGFYFERKGIHDFIEIAKQLPEYTFIWFGYSPMITVTKPIRKAMKSLPKNLILPGYIAGDVIIGAYQAADLFFFPSYEETEGIVVLEALASKTQILVRDIPVYQPWLQDKVHCYKGHNNLEFVNLIKHILNNELPETKEKAFELALERSLEKIGQQLQNVYASLLNEKK